MAFLSHKVFKGLFGILVSLAFLVWIFENTDWSAVRSHMAHMNWFWMFAALGVTFLHFYLRALRWSLFLPLHQTPSTKVLFDGIMFGNFATFLLPLRAGEFLRPWLVSKNSRLPFSTGFASVVVERFFDLSAVLICFAVLVLGGEVESEALVAGAWALSFLGIALSVFLVAGSFFPKQILHCIEFFFSVFPEKLRNPLLTLAHNVLEGASLLRSPRRVLGVLFLTACIWATSFWLFDVFLRLFQFPSSFGFAISLGVIVALAVALPSAPGFVGVFQTACVLAFQQYGLSQSQAVAYSLVNHAFQYVVFVLYGIYILLHYGVSLAAMRKRVEEAD